jgi:RNA polymerase sigma-70 factor (ECF subfamily)
VEGRTDRLTELLVKASCGVAAEERAAFAALMEEARARVCWRARRVLGDEGLADEVTTRAFAKGWRNRKRFDPGKAGAATWLDKIVQRLALDAAEQRQQERAREVSGFESGGEEEGAAPRFDLEDDVEPAPFEEAGAPLAGALVREALARLKEQDRRVLELSCFERLSYKEIAEVLGLTVQAVGPRLTRARQRLLEVLDPEAIL